MALDLVESKNSAEAASGEAVPEASGDNHRWREWIAVLTLIGASLAICLYDVGKTGPLWTDSPRYANGAVLMHDWFLSGRWTEPYQFARAHYVKRPGFTIPYHPPVYPGLMGLFFIVFGVSYTAARVFIAICLAGAACCLLYLLRHLGASRGVAWASTVVLITMPSVVGWARDTMSEVPALMFILLASWLLVKWLDTEKNRYVWAAFGVAELAFLSRVMTAGILPAWFMFAIATGRTRRLFSLPVMICSVAYLAVNVAWVKVVARFCQYEIGFNTPGQRLQLLTWENLSFHLGELPKLAGWPVVVVAMFGIAGLIYLRRKRRDARQGTFWLCWFASYYAFQLAMGLDEARYFFFALPAVAGFMACALSVPKRPIVRRTAAALVLLACLGPNLWAMRNVPHGIVGFDAVAAELARGQQPGNILTACWHDQELIFRYDEVEPRDADSRMIVRGDRTLAVRPPGYAKVPAKIVAKDAKDLLDIVRKGRIRYLVTAGPKGELASQRTPEMKLAHKVAGSHPDQFRSVGRYPLRVGFKQKELQGQVYIWEYLGELPPGISELGVKIPTANLELIPQQEVGTKPTEE